MASLNSLYVKKETLQKLISVLNKKKGKDSQGIELTISIGDEMNEYKQNIYAYVSQTKEQREANKERFYVGNGRTFWSDSGLPTPYDDDDDESNDDDDYGSDGDDLPF